MPEVINECPEIVACIKSSWFSDSDIAEMDSLMIKKVSNSLKLSDDVIQILIKYIGLLNDAEARVLLKKTSAEMLGKQNQKEKYSQILEQIN